MTSSAGLELVDVHAAPGDTPVLAGVSLAVAPGTCTAVVGPSGAGKTTLLRVVAGLEPARSGRVEVAGQDVTGVPADRRRLAVVFQDARLFPSMDVAENVAFPLRMAGVPAAERTLRAEEMLAEVGLGGLGSRRPRTLSGGEAQRVALARALVAEPDALLLDEPFTAVDPERRDELRELVDEVRRRHGLTTLLVTHDREDAAALGDGMAVLLDGRIAQAGSIRDVLDAPDSAEIARFVGCDVLLRTADGVLACRPERVTLGTGPHRGTVAEVRPGAEHDRVVLEVPDDGLGTQTVVARVAVGSAPEVGGSTEFDLVGAHRLPTDAPSTGAPT